MPTELPSAGATASSGDRTSLAAPLPGTAALRRPSQGVEFRAILLALLLVPLNCFFLVYALIHWGWFGGHRSIFPNVVALLFLARIVGYALGRRSPALAPAREMFSAMRRLQLLRCSCIPRAGTCSISRCRGEQKEDT